ncbi:MAG: sensor histidine kinase, partial [Eubacterium sp.]|nr:sensor histidine kinase [Eubacterium sp.]
MKVFDRFIVAVMFIIFLAVVAINLIVFGMGANDNKLYKVEINRIEQELSNGNEVSSENYDTILGIYKYNKTDDFYTSQNEYVIREINGGLYRIEYDDRFSSDSFKFPIAVNIALGIILLITLIVLLYIRYNIVKPFTEISDLPYQLSKGKLSVPLKETKKRYFGKFIWGLDMLRDELEKSKMRELERAKKEKTFLMSLSHDIKTPLSAIKLYSKAISKGLYSERQKQTEAV